MAITKTAVGPRPGTEAAQPAPEFPGCTPVHLPADEIERSDQRLEYWDGATETAWICEPASPYHERPSGRLTRLTERIAAGARRSRSKATARWTCGSTTSRAASCRPTSRSTCIPDSARLPGPSAMVIGVDDYPDVVLEVDHTTDVRRGKLALYESWGFPEVWVEVPDESAPSRPRSRRPGLTIHVLEDGRVPGGGGEPGVSGVDGGGDSRGVERTGCCQRGPARCWNGWGRCSASGRAPDRITIRCCGRNGAGGTSAALSTATNAALSTGWRRNARCCAGIAARKFDDDTAQRLAVLLERTADADRLAQAGVLDHRVRDRSRAPRPGIRRHRAPDVTRQGTGVLRLWKEPAQAIR